MSESKPFKTMILLVRPWGSEFRRRQEGLDPVGLTSRGSGQRGPRGGLGVTGHGAKLAEAAGG